MAEPLAMDCMMSEISKYVKGDLPASALITIDIQQDALDGQPFEVPGTSEILPNMISLVRGYRKRGQLVVHVVRIYKEDGSNVDLCRRELIENGANLLLAGTPGCQLAEGLRPDPRELDTELLLKGGIQELGPNEVVIYKPRWGAFYETPLEVLLRKHSISTLVFSGCNFPNCPRASVYEASERDFCIIVVKDAISGLYERALQELQNIGVSIQTTEELVNRLQ